MNDPIVAHLGLSKKAHDRCSVIGHDSSGFQWLKPGAAVRCDGSTAFGTDDVQRVDRAFGIACVEVVRLD